MCIILIQYRLFTESKSCVLGGEFALSCNVLTVLQGLKYLLRELGLFRLEMRMLSWIFSVCIDIFWDGLKKKKQTLLSDAQCQDKRQKAQIEEAIFKAKNKTFLNWQNIDISCPDKFWSLHF